MIIIFNCSLVHDDFPVFVTKLLLCFFQTKPLLQPLPMFITYSGMSTGNSLVVGYTY